MMKTKVGWDLAAASWRGFNVRRRELIGGHRNKEDRETEGDEEEGGGGLGGREE